MVIGISEIAHAAGITVGELALRFAISNAGISVTVVGCRSEEQAAQNFSAAERGPLDAELIEAITRLWTERIVHGTYLGSS